MTREQVIALRDGAWSLSQQLILLNLTLHRQLDYLPPARGELNDLCVRLAFQMDQIDATMWLAEEVKAAAKKLDNLVHEVTEGML